MNYGWSKEGGKGREGKVVEGLQRLGRRDERARMGMNKGMASEWAGEERSGTIARTHASKINTGGRMGWTALGTRIAWKYKVGWGEQVGTEWSRERHTRPKGRRARGPALRTVPVICGTHATEQY